MLPARTVVIEGERIQSIGSPEHPVRTPRGARVIDGRGKFLIPGLIDAHVHVTYVLDFAHLTGDQIFPLFLGNGVTSIRSTGDLIVAQKLLSRYAEEHPELSPRLFLCSPLIDGDPPFHGYWGRAVTNPDKVPELVADMADWGVSTFKLYVGTERPVGRKVIEEAHKRGLVVTGHLGKYSAQDAVADGIDCLEHIWGVFNFIFPPGAVKPGVPALERRANVDLQSPIARDLIAAIKARGVFVDPTLAVFRNMLLLADLPEYYQHPDNAHVPEPLMKYWMKYRAGRMSTTFTPETLDLRKREFEKYKELTGILYRAGVPLLAGTDAPEPFCPPGFSLHQELEMLVESGLPPAAALQAATINNARVLRAEGKLGSIEPGKLADMVILNADPLALIQNSRKIFKVIKDGRVYDPNRLLRRAGSN
ncbi:MAG TPA: amidohydrolase family protein [Bryobacteraceae bacterium]|nr:amidohydrolase family protein [Bryobacteraceae bacterium]